MVDRDDSEPGTASAAQDRSLEALQQARRRGIGRLFLLARQDFLTRLHARMQGDASQPLLAASRLLPWLDVAGTRSVELARRMGVTKQAVVRVVRDLEDAGLLAREPDPQDGRAWLVRFTPAGLRYLERMHRMIEAIERDYERELGAEQMRMTRETLEAIAYGRPDREAAPPGERRRKRGRERGAR